MKKFIIVVTAFVAVLFVGYQAYYRLGAYIDLRPNTPVTTFMKTDEDTIYMEKEGEYVPFEIRGVDMGVGIPGQWATDFAIEKDTYIRWFGMIQDMGANTIRVYTILHQDFYDALYEYNTQREEDGLEPLYLLHGVWVNDYVLFSHRDAYDPEFLDTFLEDCRTVIDIIHGDRSLSLGYENRGSGNYRRDVSKWVLGYILGVEWEDYTVVYTDQAQEENSSYEGTYLYTTDNARPFEAMLAQVGDKAIEYESNRYKQQRLVAFANWPTTDPFRYPMSVVFSKQKMGQVDVEHIQSKNTFISGMFASYHIYSYYPDYLEIMRDVGASYTDEEIIQRIGTARASNILYRMSKLKGPSIEDYVYEGDYKDSQGRYNTYLAYLKALTRYHTMPVVISEFGVTTGRGMAQLDRNTNRNQGHMSEQEQGQAIIDCFEDIRAAGCAGGCVFTWQDEWFKRTWNTMHAVDLDYTAYWSDYQTNEQFFGLLSFDPGEEKSVCYVDGDISEWTEEDLVSSNGDADLSMKYDEKFLYFLVHKEGLDQEGDSLYIPIDTQPKVGSTYAEEQDVSFERPADFLMVIHGKEDSHVYVQERYECLNAIYGASYYGINPYYDPPEVHSPRFTQIGMALTLEDYIPDYSAIYQPAGEMFETGKLRHGNANPDSEAFDSLADFMFAGDYVEIRIPWELLNFSDPSNMMIHDDYYECYGIENYHIDEMYVGVTDGQQKGWRTPMDAFALEGWGKDVTYHERLKRSYYMLKDYWTGLA